MTTDNIIEVRFGNSTLVSISPKYRYDSGWIMKFVDLDLPESYQVHFGNTLDGDTYEAIGDSNGVEIPDILWENGEIIYCWLYLHPTEDSSITKKEVRIAVGNRGKLPTGVTPEPHEQSTIDQLIGALNSAVEQTSEDVESAEQAKDDAITARNNAQGYAENAQSSANASSHSATASSGSAQSAAQSAESAARSASEAEQDRMDADRYARASAQSADRAEQAANNAGYLDVEIVDGRLIYTRTDAVDVDFSLNNGRLIMEAI